ncbi:uncharacterized protein isoform X2 [Leptinotarsa decemlineata]|uniref:uncharacterized protein isoform X2 n=1 Tax=Leptinotarsa decemlineata TaxID=7539 RepID=UPI003D309BD1
MDDQTVTLQELEDSKVKCTDLKFTPDQESCFYSKQFPSVNTDFVKSEINSEIELGKSEDEDDVFYENFGEKITKTEVGSRSEQDSSGKSQKIKLQDNETIKFIELYASERVLYDSTCKDYKDRDLRLAAAKRISEAMGINGFGPKEVITKFKNLRSSYCQELKKIADTERSGSGTDDVYVPKVIWFENMNSFIRPFVQQRSTKSNLMMPANPTSPHSVGDDWQEHSIDICSENTPNTASHSKSTVTPDAINTTVQSEKMEEAPATPYGKRKTPSEPSPSQRKKIAQDPQINFMCSAIQKLDDISTRAAQIPKEDCYDYFGKYVASMLRNIGPPTAMRLQDQITRLVTQTMCPPPNTWSRPPSSNQLSNDNTSLGGASDYSNDFTYELL